MITEADIEKLVFRCFENYWNTRMSKKHNVSRVSKIAGNDVWQVVKQYLRSESSKDSDNA